MSTLPTTDSTAAALASSTPEELTAAAVQAVATARCAIDGIIANPPGPEALLDAYDEATAALTNTGDVADLVTEAHPDPAMRTAAEAATKRIQHCLTEISLNRDIYDSLRSLELAGADEATRHFVTRTLLEFRRAGVDRDDATRTRIGELQQALVEAGQAFARNIKSDTRTAQLPASALAGMPADWVSKHPPGPAGTVTVTTDNPDVVPLLTYSQDSTAREQMLRLWRSRGHPANIEVLDRMLALRHELAQLLGYRNWAHYATETKMIGDDEAASDLVTRISQLAADRMERERAALLAQKRTEEPDADTVHPWDSRYLQERVRAERHELDSQQLRPYFEYSRVRDGLLAVTARLFAVEFVPRPDLPVWHPEVEAFDVREHGVLCGRIFLDMHPRPDKFSHAAMYSMVSGKAGVRVPECALLCNFSRPGELLEHGDVSTFFHEFGHLLHHVFGGTQRWSGVSGIKTERDFVEAPSQLLEEWAQDEATLATFARHHEHNDPIPAELVHRLRAADAFGRGLLVRQQLFYAALSLELHRRDPTGLDPLAVEQQTQDQHAPFPHIPDTWMHLSFGHLDGYSATYYTYLWSEVIAKDMFSAFDQKDLLDPQTALRYREAILAPGGSAPAAELVRAFLGRDYTFDAFGAWLEEPIELPSAL